MAGIVDDIILFFALNGALIFIVFFLFFVFGLFILLLKYKYGKVIFPKLNFPYIIEKVDAIGALNKDDFFGSDREFPLRYRGMDRGIVLEDKNTGIKTMMMQGNFLKPQEKPEMIIIPSNENFNWGDKRLKVAYTMDLHSPIIIPPTYTHKSFKSPAFLSEADKMAIIKASRDISLKSELKEESWLDKHGMTVLLLVFVVASIAILSSMMGSTNDAQVKIAQSQLAIAESYERATFFFVNQTNYTLNRMTGTVPASGGNPIVPWLQ